MGRIKRKRNEKMAKFSHLLAALILLIHGYEKFADEHINSGLLFIACGFIFMIVALLHKQLHHKVRSVDAIFAVLEGIAALTLAADYWHNKHYLHFAYVFVAMIYLGRGVILFIKGNGKVGDNHAAPVTG